METESYDPNELYRLDEAIRSTMETVRRAQPFGSGVGGPFGFQQQGGWQPGQNAEQIAESIRERVASAVRERIAESVRSQLRHVLRERIGDAIREHLGAALREELRQAAMQ